MKQILLSILCAIFCILPISAFADSDMSKASTSKTLVVYFSCTGNTKNVADNIMNILDADEFRIEPEVPYTSEDLNYNDNSCRANQEQNNSAARPAITNTLSNINDYDVVYLGFPIWWGKLPKIMYTFFDTYNLSGKTIVPFCTSGSSGISTAVSEIRILEPDATVNAGSRFSGGEPESTIRLWVENVVATGIEAIVDDAQEENTQAYNIQGQAISENSETCVIIQKGKKYIKIR